jgi:hypothetical protein
MTFASALVFTAAPSQAAVACSGTVTYSKSYPATNPVGELTIYYNSTNGGTNSACFYHRGAAYGVAATTEVQTFRCAERSGEGQACTATASSSVDRGSYRYYAGPRGVTGTANYCVAAYGEIVWGGSTYWIRSGRQGC